jgi:hypothetical protein
MDAKLCGNAVLLTDALRLTRNPSSGGKGNGKRTATDHCTNAIAARTTTEGVPTRMPDLAGMLLPAASQLERPVANNGVPMPNRMANDEIENEQIGSQ